MKILKNDLISLKGRIYSDQAWNQVRAQISDQARHQLWFQVSDRVWAQVTEPIRINLNENFNK
jgi:hypothetical protein